VAFLLYSLVLPDKKETKLVKIASNTGHHNDLSSDSADTSSHWRATAIKGHVLKQVTLLTSTEVNTLGKRNG
jgi:hypothetical protein